ncbi:MAG: hypothetical protein OXK21_03415, partial [Chloroflexota bacterium]|nr:hypothetical protein [Chloroflexota bacterium]
HVVSELAGNPVTFGADDVEFCPAPHRPPRPLPRGMMAVYGFWWNGEWLKIGRVGSNSNPRYTNHHYNPDSSNSNLAKSLAKDTRMAGVLGFDPSIPGDWIKSATSRVNILLPSEYGKGLLALLEAFMHERCRPRYEGA